MISATLKSSLSKMISLSEKSACQNEFSLPRMPPRVAAPGAMVREESGFAEDDFSVRSSLAKMTSLDFTCRGWGWLGQEARGLKSSFGKTIRLSKRRFQTEMVSRMPCGRNF